MRQSPIAEKRTGNEYHKTRHDRQIAAVENCKAIMHDCRNYLADLRSMGSGDSDAAHSLERSLREAERMYHDLRRKLSLPASYPNADRVLDVLSTIDPVDDD